MNPDRNPDSPRTHEPAPVAVEEREALAMMIAHAALRRSDEIRHAAEKSKSAEERWRRIVPGARASWLDAADVVLNAGYRRSQERDGEVVEAEIAAVLREFCGGPALREFFCYNQPNHDGPHSYGDHLVSASVRAMMEAVVAVADEASEGIAGGVIREHIIESAEPLRAFLSSARTKGNATEVADGGASRRSETSLPPGKADGGDASRPKRGPSR